MTAPRQVLEGTTYLVTRRCFQRQFLLRPSKLVNEAFAYVLALAARRNGIEVHAYCVLSNHYHLVVTDPKARLPAFLQLLNALVARAVNAGLGRWETFWAPSSFSAVTLASSADLVDKAAYVLANPVAAGLVRAARAWPGLLSSPRDVGGRTTIRRPAHFFSKRGKLPESVDLELSTPRGFASAADFREQLEGALAAREAQAATRVRSFLGATRVMAQRSGDRPRSTERRRGLNPRVASLDKWRRLELLGRLKDFLADYRQALEAWRKKKRCRFPAGTYLMRVLHGVTCAGAE